MEVFIKMFSPVTSSVETG